MTPAQTSASPSRILVVEDELSINDVVSTSLRYQGHAVTQTDHGAKGLQPATETAFDLIVLDVLLPGLDGFDVCRRLRYTARFAVLVDRSRRARRPNQGFPHGR